MPAASVMKLLRERFDALSAADRAKYEKLAEGDKARYAKELAAVRLCFVDRALSFVHRGIKIFSRRRPQKLLPRQLQTTRTRRTTATTTMTMTTTTFRRRGKRLPQFRLAVSVTRSPTHDHHVV
jgi:hypothetical protein